LSGASGHIVHRVVPVGVYVAVFIALLLLTGATVWVARYDLGTWSFLHTPVALAIASLKALLVVLFFMHVRDSERLVWAIIAAGLLWLALLIFLTMGDYVSRESVVLPLSMSTMMPAG
jgi:cytochrome c oxidase subunit 4